MNCSGIDALSGHPIEILFDETIHSVRPVDPAVAGRRYLAPGFVDIQVNGFAGVDFNDPQAPVADIARAIAAILATGTTRCLPTVITGGPEDMLNSLANLQAARREIPNGAAIAGFHVEGPFIADEDGPRGAHPLRWVRKPDFDEYRRWQDATDGSVRLVTLSPHWPEAPEWIARVVADGAADNVAVSIGHTNATADQIAAAVDAGATLSTHLGNGAHAVMRRHPNYLWDQLAEDRLSASFIVDGIHIGRAFLKTALRAKTVDRAVLVTDASSPAGAAPGRYRLGEQDADLTPDGRVVLAGTERLAGSALLMHDGIANLMRIAALPLADAVRMSTTNPASIVHLEGRRRGLQPGETADIVSFQLRPDGGLDIEDVYLSGSRIS
jgi:N-acetylglucosamine-6-phosphate deacetylase